MRVVNVRHERCTHYIGRMSCYNSAQHGIFTNLGNPFGLPASPWGKKNMRETAIQSFEDWARSQPVILQRIAALPEDAILGCWCKPQQCHGDVIIKLYSELKGKP